MISTGLPSGKDAWRDAGPDKRQDGRRGNRMDRVHTAVGHDGPEPRHASEPHGHRGRRTAGRRHRWRRQLLPREERRHRGAERDRGDAQHPRLQVPLLPGRWRQLECGRCDVRSPSRRRELLCRCDGPPGLRLRGAPEDQPPRHLCVFPGIRRRGAVQARPGQRVHHHGGLRLAGGGARATMHLDQRRARRGVRTWNATSRTIAGRTS